MSEETKAAAEGTMGTDEGSAKALFSDVDITPTITEATGDAQGQVEGTETKEAQEPTAPAPEGKTEKPKAPEQPYLLKVDPAKFDREHADFLRSQGVLKDDGSFDPISGTKTWREAVQGFTKARQAISTYESQLRQLQEEKPEIELNLETIKSEYQEGYNNLNTVVSLFQKLQKGTAGEKDVQDFNSWLQESFDGIKEAREEKLDVFRMNKLRAEMGLTGKGKTSVNLDELKQKSNENIAPALKPEELADQNKALNIVKNSSAMIHNLAALVYPKIYNKGENEADKASNSQTAVYKLMAENKDLTAQMVEVGRAIEVSKNLDSIKKSEYERGKADALKGKSHGTSAPTSAVVKPLPTEDQESAMSAAKGLFNDLQ